MFNIFTLMFKALIEDIKRIKKLYKCSKNLENN